MALGRERPGTHATISAKITATPRHNGIFNGHRSDVVEGTAALAIVAGEGTVADSQSAVVANAAAEGGAVAGEGAIGERQRSGVVDAAAIVGAVAGEGAVRHGRRSPINNAASRVGAVAGEGAVGHGHRAARVVDDAAAIAVVCGAVAGEGAVGHGQSSRVVDAATLAEEAGGVVAGEDAVGHAQRSRVVDPAAIVPSSVLDGQAGNGHRSATADRKHPGRGGVNGIPADREVPADRQAGSAGTADRQVFADEKLAAGQRDRARNAEVNGVAAGRISVCNRLPQRAKTAVGRTVHSDGAGENW